MGEQQPALEGKRFGRYLRRIREDRRLSLEAVEEQSTGYPERITKSHLSRIETGKAVPTFPRIYALSRIYGVPLTHLAERFELDLRAIRFGHDLTRVDLRGLADHARALTRRGAYAEALAVIDHGIERTGATAADERDARLTLRLGRLSCLAHLGNYHTAKDEAETLMQEDLTASRRVQVLYYLALCSYRLRRFRLAGIVLGQAEQALADLPADHRLRGFLPALVGQYQIAQERFDQASRAFHEAIVAFEREGDTFEECKARANRAAALIGLGQLGEAQRQLRGAMTLARMHGYDRLLALAVSHEGVVEYQRQRWTAAESAFLQSNRLARRIDHASVVFRNCYYLWRMAVAREDEAGARTNLRSLHSLHFRVGDDLPEARAYLAHFTSEAARGESR